MNVVDSCGWIEFLAGGPLSADYRPYLVETDELVTPSIVVYEVYRRVARDAGRESAVAALAQMLKTTVVPLDARLAVLAAEQSLNLKLPMADAIVYATAQSVQAVVVTSDAHFERLPDVVFLTKPPDA